MSDTNKIENMINEKAKNEGLKSADNFRKEMLRLFGVSYNQHYVSAIAEQLQESYSEEDIKTILLAMEKTIEEKAYKREKEKLLSNLREALEFMRHVEND